MNPERRAWWKEAVVYQVYPRSFADSNGDGIGDLAGLAGRADYLSKLGVDAVWLNPVYETPDADNGYDVSDYRAIDPKFGTMADWERVLEALHERDIALIMDFVPNHTSDEHDWFEASRRREDGKADWYHWRDGVDASEAAWDAAEGPEGEAPPNNWRSFFGGPAWAYDEGREQWYLHMFHRKQPDLNWENPRVREAVADDMRFWLDKGIDGFRIDVINLLSKPDGLPSGNPDEGFNGMLSQVPDGPRIHEYVSELNERVFAGEDLLTVGECIGEPSPEDARRYVGPDGDGLSMIFHFGHVGIGAGGALWESSEWSLTDLKDVFDRWQHGLYPDGWNSLYFENHDQARVVTRFGSESHRRESATCIATLLHTLRGTPYVYQGMELGMTNPEFESLDEFRDTETVDVVREAMEAGRVGSFEEVREGLNTHSRDTGRTPMHWSDDEYAGFTDGEPWIRVHDDFEDLNVEAARANPDSVWHYYRELMETRRGHDVLVYGDYENLTSEDEQLWAYTRTLEEGWEDEDGWPGSDERPGAEADASADAEDDDWQESGDWRSGGGGAPEEEGEPERALVVLNWGEDDVRFEPPGRLDGADAELLLSNYPVEPAPESVETYEPRPWEARVYRLS